LSSKELFRSLVRRRRKLLTRDEWLNLSKRLVVNLKSLLKLFSHAESFLFFYPVNREPNVLPLAEELLKTGKTVAFPRVSGREILPIKVFSLKELSPGKFGIPEPPLNYQNRLESADVVFVPGLVFDVHGFRVGYGGGFYDRFLRKFKHKAKVGVCFSFQLFSEVPHDPFDVPVDYISTEKFWVRTSKN